VCGKPGHMSAECSTENRSCYVCGELGHISAECSKETRICYICRKSDHLSNNCAKKCQPSVSTATKLVTSVRSVQRWCASFVREEATKPWTVLGRQSKPGTATALAGADHLHLCFLIGDHHVGTLSTIPIVGIHHP